MAQSGRGPPKGREAAKRGRRVRGHESRTVIDLKSLKRDAFHIVDLGGIPHAIRWTSDDFIELYEVVEG
ncbi:MAG: hypothetical protein HY557_06855 [Euryarchaeota archaeon]|nr:hypothetical protein [Euryarchaeota archaeon]